MGTGDSVFPDLAHNAPAQLTATQWRAILDSMIRVNEKNPAEGSTRPAAMPSVAQLVNTLSSQAKQALSSEGTPAASLNVMAPEQLVGLYLYRQYQTNSNEAWRAWELPVWQSAAILPDNPGRQYPPHPHPDNPFMIMIPSLRRARFQMARLDQQIQISRLIEALRDYAARHDGHAPASLDDVKDLPMPIDPFTNQRFPYRVEGATAIIEPPALTFVPQIFQITFSK
jgi:hypothetical protein